MHYGEKTIVYSSSWIYILTLYTKYVKHRIGKQKSRISKYKCTKPFGTMLKVVQISQMDYYMEIHAHIPPLVVTEYE